MKIVVFGPEKRVGALRGDQVVDLSLAYAKLLKERHDEQHPTMLAAALVPSDLAMFIDGGRRTLDCAAAALDHLFGDTHDLLGAHGETIVHAVSEVRLHAPRPSGARIACAGGNFADLTGMDCAMRSSVFRISRAHRVSGSLSNTAAALPGKMCQAPSLISPCSCGPVQPA